MQSRYLYHIIKLFKVHFWQWVIYKVNNSGNCTMAQNSLKLHAPSCMYHLGVQEFVVDLKHILIYAICCTSE